MFKLNTDLGIFVTFVPVVREILRNHTKSTKVTTDE
jgi:hypothetical protein